MHTSGSNVTVIPSASYVWRRLAMISLPLCAVHADQAADNEEHAEAIEDDAEQAEVTQEYRAPKDQADGDQDDTPEDVLHDPSSLESGGPMSDTNVANP